jgi:hypothetical protein
MHPSGLLAIRPLTVLLEEDGARGAALGMAYRAAAVAAFDGAWQGGWDAASAGITAGWADIHATARRVVPEASREVVTALQQRVAEGSAAAMRAAREASWRASRALAPRAIDLALDDIPSPEETFGEAVAQGLAAFRARMQQGRTKGSLPLPDEHPGEGLVTEYLVHTSRVVFALALGAAYHAGFHLAHLVTSSDLPNPWRPLLEVWAMGGWPLGRVHGEPHVFLPRPRN